MICKEWDNILEKEYQKKYFAELRNFVKQEYQNKNIYPESKNLFKAFLLTKPDNVKVVILGQDPYHGEGEAEGLSFSVPSNIQITPSLRNVFKELKDDLNIDRTNTELSDWALEGVLLLNSILTVEKDRPLSHKDKGWEHFTDAVISTIDNMKTPVIFVLWGNYARSKKYLIKNNKDYIIESAHPSPLSASRGFFGSKPFSKINKMLRDNNIKEIRW